MMSQDRGFDAGNLLTARLSLPDFAFSPDRRVEAAETFVARVRSVPGHDGGCRAHRPAALRVGKPHWVRHAVGFVRRMERSSMCTPSDRSSHPSTRGRSGSVCWLAAIFGPTRTRRRRRVSSSSIGHSRGST